MAHGERPGANSDPPPNAPQASSSAPGPQAENSFVAQLQSLMLTLQQANLDAQPAADTRALAAQKAAEEQARALPNSSSGRGGTGKGKRRALCPTAGDPDPFRKSDGPSYIGPYQETKAFLAWIQALEIFFNTKKVTVTNNKIRIASTLIKETNILLVYLNKARKHLKKPWNKFKQTLFEAALPVRWRQGLTTKMDEFAMLYIDQLFFIPLGTFVCVPCLLNTLL
ncbi:hypothetical protein PTTG_25713 [Puccinia triticina 1-1 BBBD Race 1]|uniref:Uncharacterized protein n=1 Tax=Puccinia triticina (isolate 1-1 / race 1 (BBBD)) TaxID=630390 RepID=A0A180H0A1_PUCT1|nr:hypothetical protein PTTG_25713 [Puccinia triticina 1-1 BBBD Race 1]